MNTKVIKNDKKDGETSESSAESGYQYFANNDGVGYPEFAILAKSNAIKSAVIHDTENGFYLTFKTVNGDEYFLQTKRGKGSDVVRMFVNYDTVKRFIREHVEDVELSVIYE